LGLTGSQRAQYAALDRGASLDEVNRAKWRGSFGDAVIGIAGGAAAAGANCNYNQGIGPSSNNSVFVQSTGVGSRYTTGLRPAEAYNRTTHYGRTPTAADRAAIGVGKGEVADHSPSLVKRYYEGDPNIGEKAGWKMTFAERSASAADRTRMTIQSHADSNSQGGHMSAYSRVMKRKHGL
jgi:hypothetical protein